MRLGLHRRQERASRKEGGSTAQAEPSAAGKLLGVSSSYEDAELPDEAYTFM